MCSLEPDLPCRRLSFIDLAQIVESDVPASDGSGLDVPALDGSDLDDPNPSGTGLDNPNPNNTAPNGIAQQVGTPSEVYFFLCIWFQKQKRFGTDSPIMVSAELGELQHRVALILSNLGDWAEVIESLQTGDPTEWELLRFQMEKAVRRYAPEFDDALQDALLKIHDILLRLPHPGSITEYLPFEEFLQDNSKRYQSIYDYGSPFYAYAKVVARNELIGQMRKQQRHPVYHLPIEEMKGSKSLAYAAPAIDDATDGYEEREQSAIRQLKVDIALLIQTIQQLSPKQQQTTLPTLATRKQFWRAAEVTGIDPPADLCQYKDLTNDTELSAALGMTENNLRVHRQHAKKRIQAKEPMLSELFERLIAKNE